MNQIESNRIESNPIQSEYEFELKRANTLYRFLRIVSNTWLNVGAEYFEFVATTHDSPHYAFVVSKYIIRNMCFDLIH
jgi:hypothetical protein